MWVHKTPEEIAGQRRKLRIAFGQPIVFALLVIAVVIIHHLLGIGPAGAVPRPTTLSKLLRSAALLGLAVGGIGYLIQLIVGRPLLELEIGPSTVLICSRCYRMKSSDGQQSCECGGTFEDFELWKWVDEPGSQEGVEDNRPLTGVAIGSRVEPNLGDNLLRTTDGIGPRATSWEGRTAGLCTGNPRVRGIWNPAVLTRRGERTLSLEATYDPPGTVSRAIAATVVAVAIATVVKVPGPFIGFMAASGVIVSYVGILLWRKRKVTVSLENAGDVVIDQERSRIGFFVPFDHKPRWIILELKEAFADVSDAIRDVLGVKCRTDTIRGGNVLSVILLLLVGFALAFGYCMTKW